jgi:hypothetical protein
MTAISRSAYWLAALLVAIALPLEVAERSFADRPPLNPHDRSLGLNPDLVDARRPGVSLFQYDLYPFTGGHTQANVAVKGGLFRTGDHGFMVDFDLDDPPAKGDGEIRLLLVGGSAAAGHGASATEKMLHRMMERAFACPGRKLKVVNLAMGGSRSYQNFIASNLWGHALHPDAVLSFSGNNDLRIRPYLDYDGFQMVAAGQALVLASSNRGLAAVVATRYPNLVNKTVLGIALRALEFGRIREEIEADFASRFPEPAGERGETARYVHALNSIRRDFQGLPIFVAYQPFMASERNPGKTLTDWKFDVPGRLAAYARFIAQTRAALTDPAFAFLDVHDWYQKTWADRLDPGDGTHMWDDKQEFVARHLMETLGPALCARAASR